MGTAEGRWSRRLKTELDGDKWFVTKASLGATRHKSSQIGTMFSERCIIRQNQFLLSITEVKIRQIRKMR